MILMEFLKPKLLLKLAWLGFGLVGLVIVAKQYFPNFPGKLKDSNLVKGVQTELAQQTGDFSDQADQANLQNLDPQTASQVISQVIKRQITQVIQEASTEIKQFPKKTVRKIKIGACEELLEEDICAVAQELDCSSTN